MNGGLSVQIRGLENIVVVFFFSSRRRHTRSCLVSWARRCVQETDIRVRWAMIEEARDDDNAQIQVLGECFVSMSLCGAVLNYSSPNRKCSLFIYINNIHMHIHISLYLYPSLSPFFGPLPQSIVLFIRLDFEVCRDSYPSVQIQ
eukprot:TRINITY_DN5674_c0_g1_i17.p1 TRINITY_DN5674_c0_g1~~TRINITY_DN5674_c0_g1_i17.p1  ORF type:complete len:145 (+),score=15.64 TRINITY_DN5674_c0_g1_i17:3-437(+)